MSDEPRGSDKAAAVTKTDEPMEPVRQSKIPVLVVESRAPFPELALFQLDAIPRQGDNILLVIQGQGANYKVDFVNFNPFNQKSQITLGCSYSPPVAATVAPPDLKERVDQVIKANTQMFEKAQAYSNALTLGGYAGVFAVWSFSKDVLTKKTTNAAIVLIGISLILYVSWEIFGMIQRAIAQAKFVTLVDKSPVEFFQLLDRQEAENRRLAQRHFLTWKLVVLPTIVTGYAGALLLIYNAAANIFGVPQWP